MPAQVFYPRSEALMVPIDLPVVNLILRAPEGRPDIGDLKAFSVPEDNLVCCKYNRCWKWCRLYVYESSWF